MVQIANCLSGAKDLSDIKMKGNLILQQNMASNLRVLLSVGKLNTPQM
jgi:hypothetical protein